MISPLNSAGAADVDQRQLRIAESRQDVVAERSQAEVGLRQLVAGRAVGRDVHVERQALVQPVLAAAVEDPDVAVAVQLELPVRPGREPVVVVAVQHDRRVRPDPDSRQQLAEVLATGDVAADPVGQLAGPVPADGTREVALLVRGRVDVDLDEADLGVVRWASAQSLSTRACRWRIGHGRSVLPVASAMALWCGCTSTGNEKSGTLVCRRPSEDQPPDVSRSRRLNSASRSVHAPAPRARLADDPRIDPARVLDRERRPVRPIVDDDPGAVPVVGHPVGLELERDVGDDRGAEQPVEVRRVEPIGDVRQPDRPATLEPGEQVDHPHGRERVARSRRRSAAWMTGSGSPARCRAQRSEADGDRVGARSASVTWSVISD